MKGNQLKHGRKSGKDEGNEGKDERKSGKDGRQSGET